MKRIYIATFLVMFLVSLACGFTVNVPVQPPAEPTEWAKFTYLYEASTTTPGGYQVAFLVENIPGPLTSIDLMNTPDTTGDVLALTSSSPRRGITIKVSGTDQELRGVTDDTGHLFLDAPFKITKASLVVDSLDAIWFCEMIVPWATSSDGQVVTSAGGIFQCYK